MSIAKITDYEKQYMEILSKIYYEGFSDGVNERTGVATKRLPGVTMTLDVGKEFPILHSKKVAAKTALREIEWIWKDMSNNVNDLKAHIWDAWADNNGSIGKSYGNQIDQPVCIYTDTKKRCADNFRAYENQRDFVRQYLKEFPNGRQCTTTIWNPSQLAQMNLVPCVHTCMWNLDGGRLNLTLCQRSGDFPVGVPFNTTQYAQLMYMFAYELGVEPGILTHTIADAHIYDRQMNGVSLQLKYYELMKEAVVMIQSGSDHKKIVDLAESIYSDKDHYEDEIPESHILVMNAKNAVTNNTEFLIHSEDRDMMSYRAEQCEISNYSYVGSVTFGDIVV